MSNRLQFNFVTEPVRRLSLVDRLGGFAFPAALAMVIAVGSVIGYVVGG